MKQPDDCPSLPHGRKLDTLLIEQYIRRVELAEAVRVLRLTGQRPSGYAVLQRRRYGQAIEREMDALLDQMVPDDFPD